MSSHHHVLNSVPYQRDKTRILTSVQCHQLATHISHFSRRSQTSGKHCLHQLPLTHLLNSSSPFSLLQPHPDHHPIGAFYRITSLLPNSVALTSAYLFLNFLILCTFFVIVQSPLVYSPFLASVGHHVPPSPWLVALGLLQGLLFL